MAGTLGDRRFTRIPPESTGDRIRLEHIRAVPFDTLTGTFSVEDVVTFVTSNTTGEVIDVQVAGTTGILYVLMAVADEDTTPVDGEAIQVNSVTIAVTNGVGHCLYTNTTMLVGGNNPFYRQKVDGAGQAHVRFGEGAIQFDAYGRLRGSNDTLIAGYSPTYDALSSLHTVVVAGAGAVSYATGSSSILHSNGTASGDISQRTTDLCHKYIPGASQLIEMSVQCGDEGKANLVREWGYFDSSNGIIFRQNQVSGFEICIRNDSNGSIVESTVSQSAFNGDTVDGSKDLGNISLITLNTATTNQYWIDMQGHSAGRVRVGVIAKNNRITMHTFDLTNINTLGFMRTSSLPIRQRQENLDGTASTSEMRAFTSSVRTSDESFANIIDKLPGHHGHFDRLGVSGVFLPTGEEKYLLTLQPKLNFKGKLNKKVSLLDDLYVFPHQSGNDLVGAHILVKLYVNPVVTGAVYVSGDPDSVITVDVAGGLSGYNPHAFAWTVDQTKEVHFHDNAATYADTLRVIRTDGGEAKNLTLTATPLNSFATKMNYIVNWFEVSD